MKWGSSCIFEMPESSSLLFNISRTRRRVVLPAPDLSIQSNREHFACILNSGKFGANQ